MARLIDFGAPYGVVSFPDDATDEQIVNEHDAIRGRAIQAAKLQTQAATDEMERLQPTLGKYLTRTGLALGEQTAGAAKETVGNIARTIGDIFSTQSRNEMRNNPPPAGMQYVENPEAPQNILKEAGKSLAEEGSTQRKTAAELGESIGGGFGPAIAENLAGTAGVSATALPAAVFGLGPAAVAAALQQYTLQLDDFKDTIMSRNPKLSEEEAYKQAQGPAALTGVATGVLTRGFGGVEKFIEKIAKEGIGQSGVKALLKEAFKSASLEFPEEYGDQLSQGFTEKAFVNPDKPIKDIFDEAGLAGLAGFALGGLTTGAIAAPLAAGSKIAERITEPSRLRRQGESRRRAVISREVEQGNLLPQTTGEQNAESIRAETQTGSQAETPVQETDRGVRLRNPPENGMEAQAGAPLAQPVGWSDVGQTDTTVKKQAPADVLRIISDVTSKWSNAPTFMVVETADQLPEGVKSSALNQNLDLQSAAGAVDNQGRVWLVSNNLNGPEHARRILLHESVGHFGVDTIFGSPEEMMAFMQGVSERHADTEIGRNVREIYGNDPVRVGREVVAKLAENPEADPTLWQRIVATVRDWARKVFNLEVTDNDIKVLLSKGRAAVTSGKPAGVPAQATSFSQAPQQDAPVVYRGFQEGFGSIKGADLYNLTDTIAPNLVKGSTVTESALNKAGFRVPEAEKVKADAARPPGASFAVERPASPQTFQNRQQVETAISDPLLTPAKRAAAQGLAAVQSSMVSDQIMGNLMATPKDDAERYAQSRLDYLQDRRLMSDTKAFLNSLPETTEDEKRAKEVAAAVILNHYGTDRNVEREINTELASDQNAMANAVKKITKLNNAQIKANFLTSMFNRLVKDYRTYLDNIGKNLPASGNLQSQYRQRLADAERRLNEQQASPIAVQKALSAIAQQVPDTLLTANSSNDAIINWALTSDVLQGVVGSEVRNWLLADDGSGEPALRGYGRLVEDLNSLREVLANQDKLASDIKAFERWFRPSGKEVKVSVKRFAEAYSKFRASRDRAAKLAAAMEKDIEDLDTRIRGNITARQWLQDLMTSDDYVKTVREAAKQADVVVRALYEGGQKTGLIERDKTVGLWRMQVPGGTPYVVDLHPSATTESINQGNLKAFAAEARQYSIDNAITNPLLADEYSRLADYIDRYMVHPALNPNQGFTQLPWIGIPGTNIRFSADPFGWTAKTIRDVLEKIGGRTALQAVRDANELDTVMRKVEGINSNSEYGYAAQTQAVLKAMDSHGWTPDQFPQWDERVAERVIAAGQNNLGPSYEVGDVIVGSGGVVLTSEDMTAIKMMKKWEDEVLKAAPKHIQDVIGKEGLGITRKAISSGQLTMARTQAPWTESFLLEWGKATTPAEKLKLLEHDNRFRRVVMGYIGEFNPEFQRMNKANPDATKFYDIFRLMAKYEKDGVQSFTNMDQVLDFMSSEMVSRGMAPDQITARKQAQESLMSDIESFIKSFQDNVVGRKVEDVWGAVPPAIVSAASARNAFTVPRGNLVAPSTFYTYSRASDGSRAHYVGSLRSLMNLKLLQSSFEMRRALEAEKTRMEERADDLAASGMTKRKAMSEMIKETTESRKASELRFDYLETINALSLLEKAFNELTKFEQSSTEHYQHGGVAALLNVFGTLKASLLSSPQAVTTNFWSGTMLGPAIVHLQTGRIARGITDFVLEPHLWSVLYKRLSSLVAGNPTMANLLNKHATMWSWMAKGIVNAANDWNRLEEIAHQSGMVTPYNLSDMVKNKAALKTTAGRLESEEEVLKRGVAITNYLMSSLATRRPIETLKATTPRWFDNMVNYTLIQAFDYETDFLKKMGWVAFNNRDDIAARNGTDYRDLSNPDNILQPGDLGLGTWKSLNRYREIFSGMGSLDQVLLDFYERTKGMTPEQRRAEPLIPDISDHAAVALQYAAITNVATETNRPFLVQGNGTDNVWKYPINTFIP